MPKLAPEQMRAVEYAKALVTDVLNAQQTGASLSRHPTDPETLLNLPSVLVGWMCSLIVQYAELKNRDPQEFWASFCQTDYEKL